MSPHDAAEDVQAVIEALTEQQRVVWVLYAQYEGQPDGQPAYLSYFSTASKARAAAKEFIADALINDNIAAEYHDELLRQIPAERIPFSVGIDGLLYLNIYSAKVE